MKQLDLRIALEAGYGCLYCLSHEEDRVSALIKKTADKLKYELWSWTVTSGLCDALGRAVDKTEDPTKALAAFIKYESHGEGPHGVNVPNKTIVIFKDLHMYLKVTNPPLVRLIKQAIKIGKATSRHLIILGPVLNLPAELEKEITVIEFPLPGRMELQAVAEKVAKDAGIALNGETDSLVDAMCGLTTSEAEDAVAASVAINKRKAITPEPIARIKMDTVKKSGILEVVENKVTMDDIGGYDLIKKYLKSVSNSFTKASKDYGNDSPRPLLLVGQAGCGKTALCTALQSVFNVPALRCESGALYGSLLGETEKNWRNVYAAARVFSPVILHMDEADGLFVGARSSGQCDGGTTSRLTKTILQDMQDSEDILFAFTANDIDGFPDPLIDRCEVWSFELPSLAERKDIWGIHIKKKKRDPEQFDIGRFASLSEGYSGRQIEFAWKAAMRTAFNDSAREPKNEDVEEALSMMVPTSVTMARQIEHRRERLKGKARPASSVEQLITT